MKKIDKLFSPEGKSEFLKIILSDKKAVAQAKKILRKAYTPIPKIFKLM